MLPLIVIGASDLVEARVRQAAPPGVVPWCYSTTETAAFDLSDALDTDRREGLAPEVACSDDGWEANVAYGIDAAALSTIAKPNRLAHTGWTVVLDANIHGNDPWRSRRMINGEPQGVGHSTLIWQAATMLDAHLVVDVLSDEGLAWMFQRIAGVPWRRSS
jgi:hypothetical protein